MRPMILEPTPANVRAVRLDAELTQAQAAALVHLGDVARWSEYERGVHPIDRARWELFLIKVGLSPAFRPAPGVPVPGGRQKAAAKLKELKAS
jgi:hypothetical protein